ncbi:serine hydrolase domain-containing protein [Streptomyces tateyamensis]|uniref:serine hydrolase domain-containing protein n=1 Tax=Streptomyces tateyamensis TaxID=565073 RepID=UPI0015E8B050|nr:serine hydrolase domain-containing protein [Streptomyces tateyamensis]
MSIRQPSEPGLSILLRRPGEDAIKLHTGLANLEHVVPISPDTAFNVGSVAKQITAHLALLAAADGHLTLDQPAHTLLPRLQVHDVTIRDLITHHSGLRDAESLLSLAGFRDLDHYTADDLINLAYRQKQRAVPTGQFLYSNTNYLLLAKILETVHATDLATHARTRLFDPLGMTATHFKTDPRQLIPHAASAYRPSPADWQHTAQPATLPGPGSLWTTPTDLDRWLDHLHARWQQSGLEFPDQEAVPYRSAAQDQYLYGAGLYADPRTNFRVAFHYGHEQGFSAAASLGATGLRVICLSNNAALTADHAAVSLRSAAKQPGQQLADLLDHAVHGATAARQVPASDRLRQAGQHVHSDIGLFTCEEVPGSLRLTRAGDSVHLWRRGTSEEIVPTEAFKYSGHGYTITSAGKLDETDGFTLDLTRSPGLRYVRHNR